MPEFQASNDLMSPLTLFLHADAVVKVVMIGLLLASKLVDEVHFNERGNEVILVKHLDD